MIKRFLWSILWFAEIRPNYPNWNSQYITNVLFYFTDKDHKKAKVNLTYIR